MRWGHLDVVKLLTKYCSDDASADLSRELTVARHRAEAEIRVLNTSGLLRARRERIIYSQRMLEGPDEKNAVWYGRLEVVQFLLLNSMIWRSGRSACRIGCGTRVAKRINKREL